MPIFDLDTSEKIVSLVAGLIAILVFFFAKNRSASTKQSRTQNQSQNQKQSQTQHVSVIVGQAGTEDVKPLPEIKTSTSILFIDDDKTFKIVGILKKMGWLDTKLIKDINSLEDHNVVKANVLFIDIQGVGRLLQLTDEGLGLALAIKKRYPEKKIIIYSAQEEGKRFHEALAEADYFLPKTAEPIQFEEAILKVIRK